MQPSPQHSIVVGMGAANKKLTAPQKEFNKLTKQIANTRARIEQLQALSERITQRGAKEMQPLFDKRNKLDAELVHLLDRMVTKHKFNKTETRKLKHLISARSFELIEAGFEEFKAIYNRHNPDRDYESFESEADELTVTMAKEMARMMFGIEFEEDADVSTPEKMQAYLDSKLAEREATYEQKRLHSDKSREAKPKTAKQLEAEAKREAKRAKAEEKRQQEEKKIFQSVREVYMDLVKAFHPDREPDEAEKIRKTAILQRVTAAYEDNDLLMLLQLQLELERIDDAHLNTLADDKLRYFNKNLRRQAADLSQALWDIETHIGAVANLSPFEAVVPSRVEQSFERTLNELKKETRQLREELESLRDPVVLKAWLKYY